MIRQTQEQRLLQRMSPQQIQFLKLLRVSTVEMEERIKEEIEINPALEYNEDEHQENILDETPNIDNNDDEEVMQDDNGDAVDIDDYLNNENDDYPSSDNQGKTGVNLAQYEIDLHQYLLEQLNQIDFDSEEDIVIAKQIIGNIDDDGYLSRDTNAIVDDLIFNQNLFVDNDKVKKILEQIQSFEPSGVAARSLKECLLIQLKRLNPQTVVVQYASIIIEQYFDLFVNRQYAKIQNSEQIEDDVFAKIKAVILRLNPKPGLAYSESSKSSNYIIPDFYMENQEGEIKIFLNGKNAPDLKVSQLFEEMLESYSKGNNTNDKKKEEALTFIKHKIDAANWFIQSIHQRQVTLLNVMNTIVKLQREFFLTGDDSFLKPMILKDVATPTNLDISTVSRVVNSKYIQTPYGTFLLKHFFSEKIILDSGLEVTNKEIKKYLSQIIEKEDKLIPLKDDEIKELLAKEGYNISRRTVAKYREQLRIPVARLRKN